MTWVQLPLRVRFCCFEPLDVSECVHLFSRRVLRQHARPRTPRSNLHHTRDCAHTAAPRTLTIAPSLHAHFPSHLCGDNSGEHVAWAGTLYAGRKQGCMQLQLAQLLRRAHWRCRASTPVHSSGFTLLSRGTVRNDAACGGRRQTSAAGVECAVQLTVALSERIALVLGGHTHSPSDVQSCYASARTHSNIHTLACGVGGEADDRMCTARLADATSTRGHGHRGRARHARWMTCATRWSESRLVARHVVCPPTVLTKHG